MWNVISFYRAGSLMAVSKELSKYKFDLVGMQAHFFHGKGNENHELCTVFFVHKRIMVAAKMVEFLSDRISYIIIRA
jgi:hypothetical protein